MTTGMACAMWAVPFTDEGQMPEFFMVTLNGKKFRGRMSRAEADALAERYQGCSATYGGAQRGGLLKHKDLGDYAEVFRDNEAEKQFNEDFDRMKRNDPHRVIVETHE